MNDYPSAEVITGLPCEDAPLIPAQRLAEVERLIGFVTTLDRQVRNLTARVAALEATQHVSIGYPGGAVDAVVGEHPANDAPTATIPSRWQELKELEF